MYFPEKMMSAHDFRTEPETYFQNIVGDENIIEVSSYPPEDGTFIPTGTLLKDAEEMLIKAALRYTGGNRTKAAKMLGIGIRTIRRKINETE